MRNYAIKQMVIIIVCLGIFSSLVFAQSTISSDEETDYSLEIPWGNLFIAQKQNEIIPLLKDDEYVDMIYRQNNIATRSIQIPYDIEIGALENNESRNNSKKMIMDRMNNFFNDIQNNTVQTQLETHVIKDSLILIKRQLANSRRYGNNINEIRIGTIHRGSDQEYYAKIRILGQNKQNKIHAILRTYFERENNEWKISAVEGNFDMLLKPYKATGVFTPTGTLGIQQSF